MRFMQQINGVCNDPQRDTDKYSQNTRASTLGMGVCAATQCAVLGVSGDPTDTTGMPLAGVAHPGGGGASICPTASLS